jgi:hypothetical protein
MKYLVYLGAVIVVCIIAGPMVLWFLYPGNLIDDATEKGP